jgi:hypothetical protein
VTRWFCQSIRIIFDVKIVSKIIFYILCVRNNVIETLLHDEETNEVLCGQHINAVTNMA